MIELYQELVPFTNEKTTNKASQNGLYTNPILMPLSFDVTSSYNTVETVIYLRNNDKDKYYNNVHVCLLAPLEYAADSIVAATQFQFGSMVYYESGLNSFVRIRNNLSTTKFVIDTEYCHEVLPGTFNLDATSVDASIGNTTLPISGVTSATPGQNYTISQLNSEVIDVRFSLGYDEVSERNWALKHRSIIIPSIGNSSMPDNSFIPVRMRISLNNNYGDMLTLRKFAIHIAYGSEGAVI